MTRALKIGDDVIHDGTDCYVIAEIGHNHQGDLEKAKQMFKAAKDCGVHAVKIQKRFNRELFTKEMFDSPYDNENSYGPTYGAHREALEFDRAQYQELIRYASAIDVTFFATAFDFSSADFLAELNMPAYKIASGDLKNTPLLAHVARIGRPMIISTAGGTMEDVQRAHDTVLPINAEICFLQCTAGYPVDAQHMNLRVISTLREKFPDLVIGLSDHQNGIAMAVVAYTLGAGIIEKHFTLNRAWKGTDHKFSLEPIGMKKMVRDLQRARVALGNGVKEPFAFENQPLLKLGKKLVAARDLPPGHLITEDDIAIKSPSDGLPPYEFANLVGKTTVRAIREDGNILFEHVR